MFTTAKPLYSLFLAATKSNPEKAHNQILATLSQVDRNRQTAWGKWLLSQSEQSFKVPDERLKQNLWGLNWVNPLGLAPGCDKDGIAAGIWQHFGFGFAELGAVTQHPQIGNPQPRLFRLSQDKAALNRLGANNLGAVTMAQTLEKAWNQHPRQIPIGINLCKSKITPLEDAAKDYLFSFNTLKPYADYFVVNVSSPNTPGLRSLQDGNQLKGILEALQAENKHKYPLFVKIAPDLTNEAIDTILELVQAYQFSGVIATNTTIQRTGLHTEVLPATGQPITEEAGGISGKPLSQRSTEVIRYIYRQTQGKLPIIGVGGIFTPEDAWEKITAGASLLQVYTGWVYEGPWMVKAILDGILLRLEEKGFSHVSEAVGTFTDT
ncbi:MAG: quinone-dependent dihydroorotate dehydrogenase [Microcystaceae cyanobacterium]